MNVVRVNRLRVSPTKVATLFRASLSASRGISPFLSRRFKSDDVHADEPTEKGVNLKVVLGLLGATGALGLAGYYYQQDPSSQKAIEEHNAAVANEGVPARERLRKTSKLKSLLVNNQTSKLASCHGVSEILTCWAAANNPREDAHAAHFLGDYGILVGMYDGHSGFQTAEALSVFLPTYVQQVFDKMKPNTVSNTAQALSKAFEAFDFDLTEAVPRAILAANPNATKGTSLYDAFVKPAISGSVGCVALINPSGIFIANTGDCRAVLGIDRPDGTVGAAILSNDQTGDNPSEISRIRKEHPGEMCIRKGRVLGRLQPTRAFGDSRYKWEASRIKTVGLSPIDESKTPPYVTAQPEVLHTAIDESAKFLILATDGLWDVVSPHEAVQIVSSALRSGSSSLLAAAQLTEAALYEYAASSLNGDIDALLNLDPSVARSYRDDITCSVVILEPEQVVNDTSAGPDITTPSIVSNLDKPVPHTLMDVFDMQSRQGNLNKS